MPLVVDLKKGEKFIVGDTVIINDSHNRKFANGGARLYIAGDAPVLREVDILWEKDANTPAQKAYFLVQSMYLSRDAKRYAEPYLDLVAQIQKAAPDTASVFASIDELIKAGSYYKALREVKKVIKREQELAANVQTERSDSN
jgi:flagellar protein FlbT